MTATVQRSGWRHRDATVPHAGATLAPLARREASVEVGALLPPSGYDIR